MDATIIYILVSVFTPGPNNIFSSTTCADIGFKRTIPFMLGVLVGTFIVFYTSSLFNVFLLQQLPMIQSVIGIIGGGYILLLAILMLRRTTNNQTMVIKEERFFIMAILLTLINPKALIFGLSITAIYLASGATASNLLFLSIILAILCLASVFVWGAAGQLFHKVLTKYNTAYRVIMALLLGYSGVVIIVESV